MIAHDGIYLCLCFFLHCRVHHHHEKDRHEDRIGLVKNFSDDEYHVHFALLTVSDAADEINDTRE